MGLTFQQKFYQVPEKVFLVQAKCGTPVAILQIPDNHEEALNLYTMIAITYPTVQTVVIDFDSLILKGFEIKEQLKEVLDG